MSLILEIEKQHRKNIFSGNKNFFNIFFYLEIFFENDLIIFRYITRVKYLYLLCYKIILICYETMSVFPLFFIYFFHLHSTKFIAGTDLNYYFLVNRAFASRKRYGFYIFPDNTSTNF